MLYGERKIGAGARKGPDLWNWTLGSTQLESDISPGKFPGVHMLTLLAGPFFHGHKVQTQEIWGNWTATTAQGWKV